MDELSPEEIRWQMQEIEKNGILNETQKQRFQQLCQEMQPKREVVPNAKQGNATMMKNTIGNSTTSTTGSTSSFSFAAPQLIVPENTSTMFTNETFGAQSNPLAGGFNANNIFGRPAENSAPIFGGTPSFGNPLTMTNPPNTNPVFGENKNNLFGGTQTTQSFGSIAPQGNSIFGTGASHPFGQTANFGSANQTTNVFARPQTTQPITESATTTSNSIFGNAITSQAPSLFGDNKTMAGNIFGGGAVKSNNPVFGATPAPGNMTQSANIFGQTKTSSVFGGAPVFGSGSTFYNNSSSIFGGGQNSFAGNAQGGNVFGASAPSAFGTVAQTSNAFGTTTSVAPSTSVQNAPTTSPFGPVSSQFGLTNTSNTTPFARPAFGVTSTSASTPFSSAISEANNRPTTAASSPFETNVFVANSNVSSPFASTTTTTTTTSANPFAPRSQPTSSPFGPISQSQVTSSPFGKAVLDSTVNLTIVPDDSLYSPEGTLTDDEKSMYLAEQFTFGKIPTKPPTKEVM